MKKIAIFNVGGASSAYIEVDNFKIIVDLGAGNEFSPVDDFLIPLMDARKRSSGEINNYYIDQLFLTHLDSDHISDFSKFHEKFKTGLMTVPNDHLSVREDLRIDRKKIPENDIVNQILDHMQSRIPGRDGNNPDFENPLAVCDESSMNLFYLSHENCIKLDNLSDQEFERYANNISLVILFNINNYHILFTGDIMDDGMNCLINTKDVLRKKMMENGVDFLIAPHHGLDTAFPLSLFKTIRNNKVKLNIISEKKLKKEDTENRHDVDARYSSPDFSEGYKIINGLRPEAYSILTSNVLNTHILIDFDNPSPVVKRCTTEELLNEF